VRPKKSYFSSAWEYVKLPFSLRVPKKDIIEIVVEILRERAAFGLTISVLIVSDRN
jgi:creatinine amidohydrolase/Fe(II)-dependent formamide hydrolase-like protein